MGSKMIIFAHNLLYLLDISVLFIKIGYHLCSEIYFLQINTESFFKLTIWHNLHFSLVKLLENMININSFIAPELLIYYNLKLHIYQSFIYGFEIYSFHVN